jgi:predicted AlkP superfamily phosphohydrolase/phosphomutase
MNRAKTIVIGIDGGCWEYINPLMKHNRLPNIKELMDKGIYGRLNSTIPPISPVAWSSFVTGQKPYKHGIMDWFMREDDNNFRTANANDRKSVSFWNYLNKGGVKVGVVNIPMTYPAEEIHGFFISGFDSPSGSPRKVYPMKILNESKTNPKLNSLLNAPSWEIATKEKRFDDFASLYFQYIKTQTEVSMDLIRQYDVDVFIINYMVCDHFNHYMRDFSYVEKGLEIIDACIGEIKGRYDEANFIVISDHGSCRYEKIFLISDWLKSIGFIEFKNDKYLDEMFESFVSTIALRHKNLKGIWKLTNTLRSAPRIVKKFLLLAVKYYREEIYFSNENIIDREKSKILFYSPLGRAFYFYNDADCKAFCDELTKLKNPIDNKSLVNKIYFKDEICYGQSNHSPDLIALFDPRIKCNTNLFSINSSSNFAEVKSFTGHYGGHTEKGIYVFSGTCFKCGGFSSDLNIYDIPALILYLNNISIPDTFDGTVPFPLLQEDFVSDNPLSYQKSLAKEKDGKLSPLTAETEEEIKQQLINLGYL